MIRGLMVALLLVLAGCSGINGGGGPSAQTTEITSSSPTTSATTVHSIPTDATKSNTINYTALSAAQQRAFETAVQGEAQFLSQSVRESPYVEEGEYFDRDMVEPFKNHKYVRKNGSFYRLAYDIFGAETFVQFRINATERQPTENATVIEFDTLSSQVTNPVRWAIENGSYTLPWDQWRSLPDSLDGVEYIRFSDNVYRITTSHVDGRAGVLRVEKAG